MTKYLNLKFRKNLKTKKKIVKNHVSYLFFPKYNLISEINFLRNCLNYTQGDHHLKKMIKLTKKKQISFLSKISTKKNKFKIAEILFFFLKIGNKKFLSFFLIKIILKYYTSFLLWMFVFSFNFNQPKNIKDSEHFLITYKLKNKSFIFQKEFLRLKIYFLKKLHYNIYISMFNINKRKKKKKNWKIFILLRILLKIIYPKKGNGHILKKNLLDGIISKESWSFLNLGFLNLKILTIIKIQNVYGDDFGKIICILIPYLRHNKNANYHFWWKNILFLKLVSPVLYLNRNVILFRKKNLKKLRGEKSNLSYCNFSQNNLLNFLFRNYNFNNEKK